MNTEALNALALAVVLLPGVLSDGWTVRLPAGPIIAARGSTVTVPCRYGYPDPGRRRRVLSVMWCRDQARCITPRYVYHSAGILPEPAYLGRAEYLGDTVNDCTLKINGLRASDSGTYVFRFITDHPVENLPDQAGVVLLVSDAPKNTSVSVSPSGEIVDGSSVTLTCSSDANPPVQNYTWFKKNDTGVWQAGSGQSLNFSNFRSWNRGQYYCEAQNRLGAQNSTAVSINIEGGQSLIVAAAVGVAEILALVFLCVCRRRRKSTNETEEDRQGNKSPIFGNISGMAMSHTGRQDRDDGEVPLYLSVFPTNIRNKEQVLYSIVQYASIQIRPPVLPPGENIPPLYYL
ncbi:B-cell receptor CD22-like isoform X4 [Anguilla rostrata]|uniref:B-cell receptor CD22-like isoform X4 n=1 Tax=Anguilla rostrata TaxID=7938 RepID=UPI0030CB3F2D